MKKTKGIKMRPIVCYFVHLILRTFFIIFGRIEVKGLENIPKQGAFILASNHFSNFDPPIVGSFCPRKDLYFLAKEELFTNKIFGAFLKYSNAFPVKRGQADTNSMLKLFRLLDDGCGVLMFPEGTRRKNNKPIAKKGLGFVIAKSQKPVIPVRLINSSNFFKFNRLKIIYGKPILFYEFDEKLDYQEISKKVLDVIEELK